MLVNDPVRGLNVLGQMAEAAAHAAGSHIPAPYQLARCEDVEFRVGNNEPAWVLETARAFADEETVTISVFATTNGETGERMAAFGRFTFTTLGAASPYE